MIRDPNATAARPAPRSILIRAALIAGCATVLSGCYSKSSYDISALAPEDYRLRHPIAIKEQARSVELFIGATGGRLEADHRADVLAFARAWRREATGGIVIEAPAGTRNAAAAGGAAQEARSLLTAAGVPSDVVVVRGYKVANPERLATVRLSYPRMGAEAGPCGLWPANIGPTGPAYVLNKPYWNHGCATQRNLAAMVADPADLVQPRGETPAYQMRRTNVLNHYEKGEPTWSAPPPGAEEAKIGDVGR